MHNALHIRKETTPIARKDLVECSNVAILHSLDQSAFFNSLFVFLAHS